MSFPVPLDLAAEVDPEHPEPPEWKDELAELYAGMPQRAASALSERWSKVAAGPATYLAEIKLARVALSMIEQMHHAPRHAKEAAWQAFMVVADALMRASEQGEAAWCEVCEANHERMVLRQITTEGARKGGRKRAEKSSERTAARDSAICAAWKKSYERRFDSYRNREGWVSEQAPADGPPWSRSTIRRVVQKAGLERVRNGPRA